jgi:RNA 3'-terminal phosphate cyclase (ATP)
MGLRAEATLRRYGWYPAGEGQVEFQIAGCRLPSPPSTPQFPISNFHLTERGELKRVWGIAAVSNLPSHIPQRMADRAVNLLKPLDVRVKLEAAHVEATGIGVGIFVFAEYAHVTAGFCAYGRKGLPAEKVAQQACAELLAHHHAENAVDPHLADQLILPAALAAGSSHWTTSRVTPHLLTNAWVVQQFVDCEIDITGAEGQLGQVIVRSRE